jgi:hypothetical protein
MAKTLKELLEESGLNDSKSGQEKTASQARSTTAEVDEVLRNLGISDTDSVKTASEQVDNKNGGDGNMESMADIFSRLVGAPEATQEETTKVATDGEAAAAQTEATTEEVSDGTTEFGELVGHYFNEGLGSFVEKVASEMESASNAGHQPLEGIKGDGSLAAVIGKGGDPHQKVNHQATGGGRIDAMTGNVGPYTLKDKAKAKEYLKRVGSGLVGDFSA